MAGDGGPVTNASFLNLSAVRADGVAAADGAMRADGGAVADRGAVAADGVADVRIADRAKRVRKNEMRILRPGAKRHAWSGRSLSRWGYLAKCGWGVDGVLGVAIAGRADSGVGQVRHTTVG